MGDGLLFEGRKNIVIGNMKENELDIQNIEEMKLKLKDKHCGAEFVQEFEDGTKRMEQYIKAMEREIRKRRQV